MIGVGASAGGLGALKQLFEALPPKPGLAVVVVQHLDPRHDSQLTEILQGHTDLAVVNAQHGITVVRDHVYVIQPNTNVAIVDGVLSVTPRPDPKRPHYPVDHFLRSLADVQDGCSVAVILSGTGSDGTLGLCEIKAAGGVTFAQDEQSAEYAGMPKSAIASGAVDIVLPPQDIAVRLAALAQHPYRATPMADAVVTGTDDGHDFHRVITALRHTSGVDFSQYRDTTIRRRTARRMMLRGFNSPRDYAQFLEQDRSEAEAFVPGRAHQCDEFFQGSLDVRGSYLGIRLAGHGNTDVVAEGDTCRTRIRGALATRFEQDYRVCSRALTPSGSRKPPVNPGPCSRSNRGRAAAPPV